MSDPGPKPSAEERADFDRRLDKALQERKEAGGQDTTEGSAAGLALRALTELFAGLVICMVGGYFADKYLGTAPWIMLALMPVGLAAGVMNVMRLSNSKEAKQVLDGKGPVAPSIKDDDED